MQKIATILAGLILFLQPAAAQVNRDAQAYAESGYSHTKTFEQLRTILTSGGDRGPGRSNPRGWRYYPADRAYKKAATAFRESLRLDPNNLDTYEALLKLYLYNRYHEEYNPNIRDLNSADSLTLVMRSELPEEPKSWLDRGLVLQMKGDIDAAMRQFEFGKTLMSPTEREQFEITINCDQNSKSGDTRRAHQFEDPFLLTSVNEREASHYARLLYADMFYPDWRETVCNPGKITPGEVIVRYGIPREREYVTKTQLPNAKIGDDYLLLDLKTGRHDFTFHKEVPGDWFIHQSRIPDRSDIIREFPEEGDPPVKQSFDMQFLVSQFRGADGSPEVVVSAGIPVVNRPNEEDTPLAVLTGMFVVDPQRNVIDASVQSFEKLSRRQIWTADTLHVWTDAHVLSATTGNVKIKVEAESEQLISNNYELIQVDSAYGFSVSDPLLAHWIEESFDSPPPGSISRQGYQIQPAALHVFSREAPVYVYYELYELTLGADDRASYNVDVLFEPIPESTGLLSKVRGLFSRKSSASVTASFEGHVSGNFDAEYFILDSSKYAAGRYLLTLRITDISSGMETESSRTIVLE